MNESDGKLLTEWMGETWHEKVYQETHILYEDSITYYDCSCGRKDIHISHFNNRTFDTWQDLGDLKDKVVEKVEFKSFLSYAWSVFEKQNTTDFSLDWLLNPARFCQLVADYLKETA